MNIPLLRDIILAQPWWLLALLLLPLMMWWRGRIGKAPAVAFPTAFILRDLQTEMIKNAFPTEIRPAPFFPE